MVRRKIAPHQVQLDPADRGGQLIGVLGPTNTGKTHYAIERMLSHRSGLIGLPLRLLAREVYDRISARVSPREVALVTGEEKITPPDARYFVATVEAMPLDREADFVAIDEVQLAADFERGRIFTSRLLSARGRKETLFLGAETMRPILRRLFPEMSFQTSERFSTLTYAGSRKISRLHRKSAIVAFSSDAVYAIAELVRRQRGGAAVVLGALSPRTRNAQAALYQSGEVDYLVATDAIGMGLNMDIDHVAFAARRKFDGRAFRDLRPDELGQIAGRAGRHIRDGAFGVTADCPELEDDIVEAIEDHRYDPVEALQWRTDKLDFVTIEALKASFETLPPRAELRRSQPGEDEVALAVLSSREEVREAVSSPGAVSLLWDICQVPDFRKTSPDQHARLLEEIFLQVTDRGRVRESWLAPRVDQLDRTDGDIDTISGRIAHIRTWTFLSNRSAWIENAAYWQARTRSIEDSLSDALHEKLTQRFVDRRTSVLLKRLRDDAPLLAGVSDDGEVTVEGQFVGRLLGFEFLVDPQAKGPEGRRVRAAAERALSPVLASRAAALATCADDDLQLRGDGAIWWRSAQIATLAKGPTPFRPNIAIRGLDTISPHLRGRVEDRLKDFLALRVEAGVNDLILLKRAADATGDEALSGLARGLAFRLIENFGAMSRSLVADELKQLSQDERAKLRKLGVRFGEYTIHLPSLLKPASAKMLVMLWALWDGRSPDDAPPPKPGLVSFAVSPDIPHAYYYAAGYRPSGERAVRIDMLERLAGQIRSDRSAPEANNEFEATSQMMSLVGCSGEVFESILRSLGYRKQTVKRRRPAPPSPIVAEVAAVAETNATDLSMPSAADDVSAPEAVQAPPAESPVVEAAEVSPTVPAAGETNLVEVEIEVWRLAPRQSAPKRPRRHEPSEDRRRDQQAGDQKVHEGRDHRRPKRKPENGGREAGQNARPNDRHQRRGPRPADLPPRRNREPDPNSPFAVLAALKAELTSKDKT